MGDLVTLAILAESAKNLNALENLNLFLPQVTFPLLIILVYILVIVPFCIDLAKKCESTKELLKNGWTPVLSAMVISSLGGTILNQTIVKFPKVASYQPVINGVAGNLVGVQASRLSTALHQQKKNEDSKSEDDTELLLLGLVVPGHLVFNLILSMLHKAESKIVEITY